ncbi:hypothetical protein BD779DRAFT_1548997 [Infundibulicybe gibba]|nr:hypothetical protein BD779DRAFT_1548997 [Infundibulicybe gibba]
MTDKKPTILETIYAQRARDVELARNTPGKTLEDIQTSLDMHLAPPLISFVDRLRNNPSTDASGTNSSPSLMAEIKRASPSKGPIAMSTKAASQAYAYALAGASVISVLTEPTWFKGKDFILEEYQIAEARLHGADTILLIVAMLPKPRLEALYKYSVGMGMEPLVEAVELGARVIGVNNRNLHDFKVDMSTTSRLAEMVKGADGKGGVLLCALSGINGPEDVRTYKREGVDAVLVGEALMRADDTTKFIAQLLDWPETEAKAVSGGSPLVKLLDTKSPPDALGLVFGPKEDAAHIPLGLAVEIADFARSRRTDSPTPSGHPRQPPNHGSKPTRLSGHARTPLLVGIFKNQPVEEIIHTVKTTNLDLVQLYDSEASALSEYLPVPVIRVFADASGAADIGRPGIWKFTQLQLDSWKWDGIKKCTETGERGRELSVIVGAGKIGGDLARHIKELGVWGVDVDVTENGVDEIKSISE